MKDFFYGKMSFSPNSGDRELRRTLVGGVDVALRYDFYIYTWVKIIFGELSSGLSTEEAYASLLLAGDTQKAWVGKWFIIDEMDRSFSEKYHHLNGKHVGIMCMGAS